MSSLVIERNLQENGIDALYTTYGILIKNGLYRYNDIYTWGRNDYGQLGLGFGAPSVNTPTLAQKLDSLLNSTYIRVLQAITLDISGGYMVIEEVQTKRRFLYGWGRVILGHGEPYTITSIPLRCNIVNTYIIQIATSDTSIYILVDEKKGNRQIYSVGANTYGELGIGSNVDVYTPIIIPTLYGNIHQIVAGSHHVMAILQVGGINILYSWGLNDYGQLGIGSTSNENIPRLVDGIQGNIIQVACGGSFSMAIVEVAPYNRILYGWGLNDKKQLGITTNQLYETTPQEIPDIQGNIIQVACSKNYSLVLMESLPNIRYVYYWGLGFYGKFVLLDSTGLDYFIENIIQVYCDEYNGYALLSNGQVYHWDFTTYDSENSLLIPVNNPPLAFPISNVGSLESYFGKDFIYENPCDNMIPMCKRMASIALYKPVVTGGNNPKMSSNQKYSQLVRNFRR